jgi:hypothetical protein
MKMFSSGNVYLIQVRRKTDNKWGKWQPVGIEWYALSSTAQARAKKLQTDADKTPSRNASSWLAYRVMRYKAVRP